MSTNTDSKKTSVASPCSSIEGVTKNAGGMPPTMEPKAIWAENTPPNTPAKNSVDTRGSNGK